MRSLVQQVVAGLILVGICFDRQLVVHFPAVFLQASESPSLARKKWGVSL